MTGGKAYLALLPFFTSEPKYRLYFKTAIMYYIIIQIYDHRTLLKDRKNVNDFAIIVERQETHI